MRDRLDGFGTSAHVAIDRASRRAADLGEIAVSAVDLLWAVVTDDEGEAVACLRELDVDRDAIVRAIDVAQAPPRAVREGHVVHGFDAAAAIVAALREAIALGHFEAGQAHILLGLLADPDSVSAGILMSAGVTAEAVRDILRPPSDDLRVPHASISTGSMDFVDPETLSPEMRAWAEHQRELAQELEHIYDPSVPNPLRRVVGLGAVHHAGDATIELLALEIRERHALLTWRTRLANSTGWPWTPAIEVVDDRGTTYRVVRGGAGSTDLESRGDSMLVPSPPAEARSLEITVTGFEDDWNRYPPLPGWPRRRADPAFPEPFRVVVEL